MEAINLKIVFNGKRTKQISCTAPNRLFSDREKETDNINRMITISERIDINRMITISDLVTLII